MQTNEKRRTLKRALAAATGAAVIGITIPKTWIKPVVDSVVLPAHAGTSGKKSKKASKKASQEE